MSKTGQRGLASAGGLSHGTGSSSDMRHAQVVVSIGQGLAEGHSALVASSTVLLGTEDEEAATLALALALENIVGSELPHASGHCLACYQVESSTAVACALAIQAVLQFLGVSASVIDTRHLGVDT